MLMLPFGLLDQILVLEYLEIERPAGDAQEQQAEYRPDHDDPDTGPFFPVIPHLTTIT